MTLEPWVVVLTLIAVLASFCVSASAGMGGSLILVPTLALALGAKQGVALAALLLAVNNVTKVIAYRKTLPYRKALVVIALIALGASFGARLLVATPEDVVTAAVIVGFILALVAERMSLQRFKAVGGPAVAFASGATSGFSGTSGPLKGMSIRQLGLDRAHFVGAASLASLAGDATKTAVFVEARLLCAESLLIAGLAAPLTFIGTLGGRRFNQQIGEDGYTALFWAVMAGYTLRLTVNIFS